MATTSTRPVNHAAKVFLGVLAVAVLYGDRGTVHAFGTLGWLAVVFLGLFGAWGGWTAARRHFAGTSRPSPSNRAALPYGVGLSLMLTLILGKGVAGDIAFWAAGAFIVCFVGCFYATYGYIRLTA